MTTTDVSNLYWKVDTIDFNVFSGPDAAYISVENPTYKAWVADGNTATEIPEEQYIIDYFNANYTGGWAAFAPLVAQSTGGVATLCSASNFVTTSQAKAAALSASLTGLSTSTNSAISSSDTILSAMGKLQAQVSAALSGFNTVISNISPSLVGTGATGTQVSSTKRATLHVGFNESVTSAIGGAATAVINCKICPTNSSTEESWTTLFTFEEDQNVTLAVALQSVQVMKGAVSFEVPAGYFYKFESSGSGTNSEGILNGQQIIYG